MRQVIYAFACDRCPTVYQLREDALPRDWAEVTVGGNVEHWCSRCLKDSAWWPRGLLEAERARGEQTGRLRQRR